MKNKDIFKEIKGAKEELEKLYIEKNSSDEIQSELEKMINETDEIRNYEKEMMTLNRQIDILDNSLNSTKKSIKFEERMLDKNKKEQKYRWIPFGIIAAVFALLGVMTLTTGQWLIGALSGVISFANIVMTIALVKTAKINISNYQENIEILTKRAKIHEHKKQDLSLELEKKKNADPREKLTEETRALKLDLKLQKDFSYNINENIIYCEKWLTRLEQELMEMLENNDIDYSTLDKEDMTIANDLIYAGLSQGYTFSKKPNDSDL